MGVSILGAVHLHSMDGWALSGVGVQAPWHGVLEIVWLHCDEAFYTEHKQTVLHLWYDKTIGVRKGSKQGRIKGAMTAS